MLKGKSVIAAKLKDFNSRLAKDNTKGSVSQKEKDLIPMLEVALEMYARGISFINLDIENSETKIFKVVEINSKKFILPAFIVLDGLGEVNAQSIVDARKVAPFASFKDLQERTNITKTNSLLLKSLGVLDHLSEETNIS
ncbi:dna polymerase iii subunit alpha [Lasius niger]|uniref:Dna polymerase iii subunit alpha n=1 Tax=Lasius niger TaxID=67767 RepID=A0A0J7L6Q3_LASNI|nr:dna polymerase iii subunit alpha [Lasius niger]